jgi:hypothetical protein
MHERRKEKVHLKNRALRHHFPHYFIWSQLLIDRESVKNILCPFSAQDVYCHCATSARVFRQRNTNSTTQRISPSPSGNFRRKLSYRFDHFRREDQQQAGSMGTVQLVIETQVRLLLLIWQVSIVSMLFP